MTATRNSYQTQIALPVSIHVNRAAIQIWTRVDGDPVGRLIMPKLIAVVKEQTLLPLILQISTSANQSLNQYANAYRRTVYVPTLGTKCQVGSVENTFRQK